MRMKYKEKIKKIADNGSTLIEGDILIRDMSRVIDDVMEYRYAAEHYNKKVLDDKKSPVASSIAILIGDLEVYQEMLGITEKVGKKKTERVSKLADKM